MVSPCYLLFILFLFLNLCPIVFILLRCILENDWLETLDVEYIYGFVWWGVCKQSRWRHSVTEPSEDSGYVLLWQRCDNNKMVAMRYYGNVVITTRWWLCVTILHLQQYSHRLNLLYIFCWIWYKCLSKYVELKCQLDAIEVFVADLIACSTCFGHHYAHHQELKSIIQWLLPVVFENHSTKYHRQQPLYNTLELLMMGIVVPETCWASNKICYKNLCCI